MFIVSEKHLKEDNLSVVELLSLMVLDGRIPQVPDDSTLKLLQEKGLIKIGTTHTELREEGINIIRKYLVDEFDPVTKKVKSIQKKSVRFISKTVEDNIDEYRNIFKGLKTGSMGDPKSCKEKLTRWMTDNPNIPFDKIIKAAKMYVGSVENMKFLQRADYFIYKVNENKEEISTLSSIIDEVDDSGVVTDGWTSSIS